jgi:hypothetical protein
MATMTEIDWPAEAVRLRREEKMATKDIAARVERSESQVRKVIAQANAERAINGDPSQNGNGPSHVGFSTHDPIPGQTTVDDHLAEEPNDYDREDVVDGIDGEGNVVDPADDPEHPDTLAEFRANAGEAVGPMPPQPVPNYGDVVIEDLRVDGTTQFALDLGGDTATEAQVTFSGTFPSGFFRKGDVFAGRFEARIVGVAAKDKLDKPSQTFRSGPQKYVAQIVDLEVD